MQNMRVQQSYPRKDGLPTAMPRKLYVLCVGRNPVLKLRPQSADGPKVAKSLLTFEKK